MLTVVTAAETTKLTTLESVKDDLAITGTDEDTFLEKAISRASEFIVNHLKVGSADDGSVTIGRETLSERFDLDGSAPHLLFSRIVPRAWPCTVVSVTEGETLLAASEYRLEAGGLLRRMSSDTPSDWPSGKVVAVYTAGWALPGDTGRNMPQVLEDAAIGLIKQARLNRTRDQTLRSENILEGLYSYTLFAPSDNPGGIPDDIAAMLAPFVNRVVA